MLTSLELGEGLLGFTRHNCDHQDRLGEGKIVEKSGGGKQKERTEWDIFIT